MKPTFNEIFEKIIPFMPEQLVSSEVLSLFKKLNEKFPEKLSSDGLFECPLGINNPVSDLSLYVSDTGREVLAGKIESNYIEESLLKSPLWKRICSFSKTWFSREIYQNTGKMGLEFDLESLYKDIPVPGIFFNGHISPGKDFLSHKLDRYKWILQGLDTLMVKPLKEEIRNNFIYCLDSIPPGGRLDYTGLMLSRPAEAVRIVVCIPEEDLKDYLSLIKYPGLSQELLELVKELSQFTELRYNLDISHNVMSGIGIECFLKDKKEDHKEKWKNFLNYLVERSLCITEKRDALINWLGYTYINLPDHTDPYYIFRRICHIKVVYEKDRPLSAKAYPEFFRTFEMDIIFNKLVESCNTV